MSNAFDRVLNQLTYSKIPLSTIMRWFVIIGLFLRIVTHINTFTGVTLWFVILTIYSIYSLAISIIIIRNRKSEPAIHKTRFFFGQLFVDALFCAAFFVMNGNPESDLFFNLLLPLLIILENVNTGHLLLFYYFAWSLFLLIILIVIVSFCQTGCTYQEIITNTFFPRVTLLLFLILFIINRNMTLQAQAH